MQARPVKGRISQWDEEYHRPPCCVSWQLEVPCYRMKRHPDYNTWLSGGVADNSQVSISLQYYTSSLVIVAQFIVLLITENSTPVSEIIGRTSWAPLQTCLSICMAKEVPIMRISDRFVQFETSSSRLLDLNSFFFRIGFDKNSLSKYFIKRPQVYFILSPSLL